MIPTPEVTTQEVMPAEVQVGQSILFGCSPAKVLAKTTSPEGRVSLQLGPSLAFNSKGPVRLVIT